MNNAETLEDLKLFSGRTKRVAKPRSEPARKQRSVAFHAERLRIQYEMHALREAEKDPRTVTCDVADAILCRAGLVA